MVLKTGKGIDNEGWTFIDKIAKIHYDTRIGSVGGEPLIRVYIDFDTFQLAEELFYDLDTRIYLMSDEGKTIEKIN